MENSIRVHDFLEPPHGEADAHSYHTSVEKKIDAALTPFQDFIKSQAVASFFLFLCSFVAISWASIPSLKNFYGAFVETNIGIHVASFYVEKSLQFWVNDFLLVLFFFFVGLEIKREFLIGELTNPKLAGFAIFAAIGGMIVPALFYYVININTSTEFGWGIPIATDTAFALGIASCFKNKLPKGVITFLAALAIIDDIGAMLVIAIFYSSTMKVEMMLLSMLFFSIILLLNFSGIRRPMPYFVLGILFWFCIESAGLHGTLAGILVAFLIPARPQQGPKHFIKKSRSILSYFEQRKDKKPLILEDEMQHEALEELQQVAQEATTPLQRWEGKLELPISLIILPLFALVNAGVPISIELLGDIFTQPVSLGIICGLLLGKPLGIIVFSYIALFLKLGTLPENTHFRHISCSAILMGIGFTMSLFVADLSFDLQTELLNLSKGAILIASLFAGIAGSISFFFILSSQKTPATYD